MILILALIVSVLAVAGAFWLQWQIRDWRLSVLALLLLVLASQQAFAIFSGAKASVPSLPDPNAWLTGWTDLVVSGMAGLLILYLTSMLREREQNVETLRSQQQLLREVLRHVPHSVFWKDRELRFLGCNENLARQLGLSHPDDIIGKTDYDLTNTPEQAALYRRMDQEIVNNRQPLLNFEETVTLADGSIHNVLTNKVPLLDDSGEVMGVLGLFYDITERKRAESALRASESLYHSLVENLPLCIFRKDVEGHLTFVNQRFCQLQEKTATELVGQTTSGIYPPEIAGKYMADDRWVIETGKTLETIENHPIPSGEMLKVQIIKTPLRDADSHILGIQGIFWDITDRIQAEQALRESEEKYRNLVERAHDGICILQNTEIKYLNTQLASMCGYHPDDVLDTEFAVYVHADEVEFITDQYERHMSGAEPTQHYESALMHRDGHRIEVEVNAGLIRYDGQRASLVFVRDITARKEAERALRERDETLAHVSRLTTMGEMVAGIAHEINQPLYAIGNYATACARVLDSNGVEKADKLGEWTKQIAQQASRAGSILRRLADFSRKSSSRLTVVDLNQLVTESAELVNVDAKRYQIQTTYDLEANLPLVKVDAVQIQQVIVNLLRNAYEGTAFIDSRPNVVTVRSRRLDDSLEITIEDNGPGLPAGEEDRLFEAFFTTKSHGLGMGLAISRTIVESHGGRIVALNRKRDGTSVSFTLPMEPITLPTKKNDH